MSTFSECIERMRLMASTALEYEKTKVHQDDGFRLFAEGVAIMTEALETIHARFNENDQLKARVAELEARLAAKE